MRLTTETLVPFGSAKRLPGSPSRSMIEASVRDGQRVALNGRLTDDRVCLEDIWISGMRFTTQEAWRRFLRLQNGGELSIDVDSEELVSPAKGERLLGSPSYNTLVRCINKGRAKPGTQRTRNGPKELVFLDRIWICGRQFTSVEAWHRFIEELNS